MSRKLALAIVLTACVSTAYARVFEIRTYTTSQKIERLEALFRDHTLALFKKHGFEVIGFWVPQDPPRSENTFIYMLAFPDRETAKAQWNALRVELRRPLASRRLYEEHFQCPVKFGARHNKLFLRVEDVNQPFVTHNPDLLELVSPQLEAELTQQLSDESLREQVKGVLKKLLAGQRPLLVDVALELRVSMRTLQRRREMAQHYLLQSSLELNETAYLLGYEDANSFIRAFHKWEGMPPGEWRSSRSQNVH